MHARFTVCSLLLAVGVSARVASALPTTLDARPYAACYSDPFLSGCFSFSATLTSYFGGEPSAGHTSLYLSALAGMAQRGLAD
jgi:hypothetical protein